MVGVAHHGRGIVGEHAGNRREVAGIAVHYSKERDNCRLVGCDRIEIAHSASTFGGAHGGPVPGRKVRPDIGATMAADRASKLRLKIGEPNTIRPAIPADFYRVAALVVGAVDQQAADSH